VSARARRMQSHADEHPRREVPFETADRSADFEPDDDITTEPPK
jgi:hypothetical protein